jgi:hypothetical protein
MIRTFLISDILILITAGAAFGHCEASGRPDFIPLLLAWDEIDYEKIRTRIGGVIRSLEKEKP